MAPEPLPQAPQIRRLLDLAGHLLCFLNHLVKLPPQGQQSSPMTSGSQPRTQ
jgi:hypothetical protein